jgi:hypothetical protein
VTGKGFPHPAGTVIKEPEVDRPDFRFCYLREMTWTSVSAIPAHWMRDHLSEIAISITAMILVVAGPYINAGLKLLTGKLHWLMRYTLFVLLSTVGYGLLTNYSYRGMRGMLLGLTGWQLVGMVAGVHLVLAWLLKRDKAI